MLSLQIGWAYLCALGIAVVLASGLERAVPLGLKFRGMGIAGAGAMIVVIALLVVELILGFAVARFSVAWVRSLDGVTASAVPFGAAGLGLCALALMTVLVPRFSPLSVIVFTAPALLSLYVASRLSESHAGLSQLLTPAFAVALVIVFSAIGKAKIAEGNASALRAKAVEEALLADDVAAVDRLTGDGEEIDASLAGQVNKKPNGLALTRLLDSQHKSYILDVLRTARDGKDPASSASRAFITYRSGWGEDIDSILLVFCAARDLPVGLLATVKRAPYGVEAPLQHLLQAGETQAAQRLLGAAGLIDGQGRLLPTAYGMAGVLSPMSVLPEFVLRHTDPDLLLVYAVAAALAGKEK
jgi:hypothetical protein